MRFSLALSTVLSIAALGALDLKAQATAAGGGCIAGGGAVTAPVALGGSPRIGNFSFAISYTAPAPSVACFALFGLCQPMPYPSYSPVPPPCAAPCGRVVALSPVPVLLGSNIPPTPTTFPIPIPNLPGLVGAVFCMQYLCFDGTGCTGVSQGMRIQIQP